MKYGARAHPWVCWRRCKHPGAFIWPELAVTLAGLTRVAAAVILIAGAGWARAETNEAAVSGTTTNLTAIPLSEIAVRAESTRARLHTIEAASATDSASGIVQRDL